MSPAPDQDPNPLISLFRRCVVCITDEQGRFRGSGFFAAPGRVVTCGHVVHGAATLRLQWQDQTARVSGVAAVPPLESVANPRNYPLPDLAVLNVDDAAGWGHPCAALTAEQPVLAASRDGLYLAGYTVEHGPTPALTGATTEFESLISEDGYTFFKLKRGLVLHGFSGSPLLDLRTGLVTGITESTRGADSDLGGFAVPAAELAAAFPELLEANRAFQLEDKRWNAAAEAEKTRAKERKGGRGRLPLRQPVVPLMPDEDLSPAKILRPRHAVVGYVGRQQLLAELADWCELEPDDGGPVGLWFVTGAGGFGKTRLAVEACREAEARGWTAGLLSPDVSPEGLQALAEWPGRLLIALDYAETAPVLAGRLTEELAARATRPAARVMLLVRRRASRAELLEWFNEQHEEQLDALLRHAQISRLDDEASEVDRLELFRQGTEDFSPFLGPPPVGLRVPRLRAAHFDRPLYVLAAAYLARASAGADVDALSEAGLLRALLDQHEAMHWARLDKQRDLGLHPADQRAAVAVATLITADGDDEALAVARLIPHLDGEPESRLIAVARWLAGLYPPAGGARQLVIAPLEPDRLGEILVGDVLAQHPGLLAAALDAASDSQLARALTVAGRVARDDQAVNAQLRDALDDRLPGFIQRCLGADGGDLLSAVTTATVISRPARGALESAGMFPNVLPIWARPLAVTITDIAVDGLRVQAGDDPTAVPHLAIWLNELANRLSAVGRQEEALETAGEAVAHYRQLAEASPAMYLPDLAGTLSNLAGRLSEVGQREEALQTAREAVAIGRQLAGASPAHLSGLAMSLNNLAAFLSAVGRREEGLETAREAVAIGRQLAEASPAAYLPDLATSLSNLANGLYTVGRREEGLEAAGEAVAIHRQLAEASPAAHLSGLATSLNNLAVFLSAAGRREEALQTAGEAVAIRRQLAEASPAAYLPDLAGSLTNLAMGLSYVGRREEALETAGEAVAHYRQLAEASPAAYLPDLTSSLTNLAVFLGDVGRREEALETAGEAVANYRQLAEASPAAYLPNLATSLNNLANRLSEAGQAGHADQLFADVLGVFPDTTRGIGHILLARGRWRAAQTRLADAISDLAAAVSASDRDGDRVTRGQARRELRMLRENDQPAFDHAWVQVNGPIPVWLDHLTDTQLVIDKVLAWMRTPGWEASRSYLDDNAANLLTDEAQAATEHLIDVNPAVDTLRDYLELLKAARLHGADAAYASYQDQLLARGLTQTLGQWLAAPTWVASRAFAAAHGDSLLHPATRAILDDLNNKNPADLGLRLFRGLLGYAATVGFDAAYDLLPDTDHQRAVIADPATSAGIRLAVARMHSAQAADDPEAHFELAAITLLGIPDQANTEAASPLTREAAAALSDCTANAAPYERRDFVRRLSQLGAEHPALTPYIIELQDILTGNAAEALRREADTAFGVGGQRLLALRGVAGVDVPQHAEARVVGQHPLDLLPGQRRTVRHAHLPRVQRAADADPAAVVERHPRRPRRRVRHQVQQRPVRDRVGPVGHRLGLPVRGRDRAAVQVIAADHDRRGDLAGRDHLVEPHPGLVPLPVAEPADPGGQPLERDLLLRGADPPVQMLVLGEQRQHRLVRRVDVGGIAGQRRPPERALALGEQRPDVGGHEPGERERPREPAEPCLVADGVAVVEHLGARVLEAHHGSHVAGHRSTGPFSKFLRLFRGVVVPVSQFDADGQVRERVVRGRLVGDDVDGDTAPQQLGQHDRAVAHEPHRQRHARGPRGLAAPHRVVEVVGHHVQVPGRDAARKPPLIHVDH